MGLHAPCKGFESHPLGSWGGLHSGGPRRSSSAYPSAPTHPLHARLLLNAAQLGQTDKAEQIIAQMFDADLDPGPKAFHVLVFAYVQGKKPQEALEVAKRASDDGEVGRKGRGRGGSVRGAVPRQCAGMRGML